MTAADTERSTASTLVQLQVPVYIPMALGAIGPTMLIPVLPLYLEDVGLGVGAVSLVLAGVGWHPGVIGIVAGRIKEKTGKPSIVIALDGQEGKGSGL